MLYTRCASSRASVDMTWYMRQHLQPFVSSRKQAAPLHMADNPTIDFEGVKRRIVSLAVRREAPSTFEGYENMIAAWMRWNFNEDGNCIFGTSCVGVELVIDFA